MKTFLYQAQTAKLGMGSFNICRNTNISKTLTIKIVRKNSWRKQAKSKLTSLLIVKSTPSQVRQLHQEFQENFDFTCSLSTFYKYKPFHNSPPIEREKESCLCIKCQNAHLLLKAVLHDIKERHQGQYTEIDFLEDITLKR